MARIHFESVFDPRRVTPVRHDWSSHPLFELPRLQALGRRLAARGAVRTTSAQATPDTRFASAPQTHPARRSPDEILADVEHADAWLALHNVQTDPEYRALVDEILDDVRPLVEEKDPGVCYRAGWIFVSSPGAVTPYHIDHENNFWLQIRGKKTARICEPTDASIVSQRSLELFHGKSSRDLVVYDAAFEQRCHAFEAEPGVGAYLPATAPHWMTNGDALSIAMSVTYFTDRTRRDELVYRANQALRERGFSPAPVGSSAVRDAAKLALARTYWGAKAIARRALGRDAYWPGAPYAPAPSP